MIAIHTKYIPASSTRGSRIKACFASLDQERAYQSCRELAAREDGLKIRDCLCALLLEEIDEELAKGKVA